MIKSMPLKWHGGKQPLATWLHSLAPASYTHRNIVFGGGLGEFWNWLPIEGISEAVNDTNGELINLYEIIANPILFPHFHRSLEFTLFSQVEFETSVNFAPSAPNIQKVQRAWSFFVKYRLSRQGLGKDYATPTTRTRRGMNENVSAWLSSVDGLPDCHERLRRVEIRNLDCIDFIKKYDHENALFYCDAPYVLSTRRTNGEYGQHEMTDEKHEQLIDTLTRISGKAMVSMYHHPIYDALHLTHGWRFAECETTNKASSCKTKPKAVEVVWMNYAA